MLSSTSINALMDLVQNKLSDIMLTDREDWRETTRLQRCMVELSAMAGKGPSSLAMSHDAPKRGRRTTRASA